MRRAILDSPLTVLDACPAVSALRRKEKRGLAERIAGNAGLLIRLAHELKGLLATACAESLQATGRDIKTLRAAMADLVTAIDGLGAGVSPGELKGGAAQ